MYKILAVEDNKILNQYINEMVDWSSMDMVIAGNAFNGEQGLKMATEIKPDLVIADIDMPKLNGLEMCKLIKAQLPDVRFIFISCFDSFQYVRDAMDLGAYKYILKPVMPSVLASAVCELYDMKSERTLTEKTIEDLQDQILKDIPILRAQFFREALHTSVEYEELLSRMKFLQIPKASKYIILFAEADNTERAATDNAFAENWYLLRAGIESEFYNLPEGGQFYIVESIIGSIMLVLCFDNESNINGDSLVEWVDGLMQIIKHRFGQSLTVILSEFCQLAQIREQYIKVRNTASSQFYSGGNHIVIAGETSTMPLEIDLPAVLEDVKDLITFLTQESIESFLDKYYTTNMQFSSEHLRLQSIAILTFVQIMLLEKNLTFENVIGSDTIALEKLVKIGTILDLRQWMRNILYAINEIMVQDKSEESGRNDKIVAEIQHRIENNYAEYFGLGDITKDLQISASHANFIFKSRTGITIFDFLVRTKMEAAMSMLKDPFIRVYEVANSVGYENVSHFISVFKAHTGMTPKQFTNKV